METIKDGQFKEVGSFEIPEAQFSELLGAFEYGSRWKLAMVLAESRFPDADIRNVVIYP